MQVFNGNYCEFGNGLLNYYKEFVSLTNQKLIFNIKLLNF